MSGDRDWQWAYYRPLAGGPRLVPAPSPGRPSQALLALRRANAAEVARDEADAREFAQSIREQRARDEHDRLVALVREFGREAVVSILRRSGGDPTYQLPDDIGGNI